MGGGRGFLFRRSVNVHRNMLADNREVHVLSGRHGGTHSQVLRLHFSLDGDDSSHNAHRRPRINRRGDPDRVSVASIHTRLHRRAWTLSRCTGEPCTQTKAEF